jgi:archaemetzincin
MKRIQLLALGETNCQQVSELSKSLAMELGRECDVLTPDMDLSAAFNVTRGQYSSTQILACMQNQVTPETWRLLGVTSVDLYIPVLTFVFGEAQLQGISAIVSTCRLRQEFYGLPADEQLVTQRLFKEAVHELGHTFGLTHCHDVECVMAASHAVEWIDLKSGHFCSKCAAAAAEQGCIPLGALG